MNIPLRNRKKEIVGYSIVSEEDFEHLSKFKWFKNKDNYVRSKINGKDWLMHRYIMIEILKNELTSKQPIDHINNNPLDNTHENLRVVTHSENSRNKKKKESTTSKYVGVCFNKQKNKWQTNISINSKILTAFYDNEIHAAFQYDLWIDEYDLKTANKNKIEEPDDFILHKPKVKNIDLPTGISKERNKLCVRVNGKYIGVFDKLEDAEIARENAKKENERIKKEKLLAIPILYNENKQCIFKIKEYEIIIDEDIYYDIIKYKWYIGSSCYINCKIDNKMVKLHRHIMNYNGNDCIDHIDGNKLNNTRANLRIASHAQNSMNKSPKKGGTSKYIGVYFNKAKLKWCAGIRVDGKSKYLGQFSDEIDAAKARDKATKEYYGEYGNLNFSDL